MALTPEQIDRLIQQADGLAPKEGSIFRALAKLTEAEVRKQDDALIQQPEELRLAAPLTDEQIQDLLLCGNPTDEEMRLIRIGWDAANGIKGGQHVE